MAHQKTGLPFAEGLEACVDLPHTITSAIAQSVHNDSILEIPKDKRPPRGIWNKPYRLGKYIDEAYGINSIPKGKIVNISEDVE